MKAEQMRVWDSLTSIVVVEDDVPARDVLSSLAEQIAQHAADSELVIVANGVSPEVTQVLRRSAESLSDVTVLFLATRIDRDTATLIGIEHAIGDWIVVLTPTMAEVENLPLVLAEAGANEVVFAGARSRDEIPLSYRLIAGLYFALYQKLTGLSMAWPAPRIRIYSRAAARYICGHLDGEFLLRSATFSGAFPAKRLHLDGLPSGDARLPNVLLAIRKGLRGLLGVSAVALRATVAFAVLGGVIAILSSLYALAVYFLGSRVEPGWTTLSLQISFMTFIFSALFALLAEYVLGLYRASFPRRRFPVVREIRSPLRRQHGRLNVVDADGAFKLGAPSHPLNDSSNTRK